MSSYPSRASDQMIDTFVVAKPKDSLRAALAELESRGGQEWWFLIIFDDETGMLWAAPFTAFRPLIEDDPTLLDRPLIDVDLPVLQVESISPETDLAIAYEKAADNQRGVVAVAVGNMSPDFSDAEDFRILGIIHAGTRQAMVTPGGGSLFDLLASSLAPNSPPVPKMEPASRSKNIPDLEPQESMRSREATREETGSSDEVAFEEMMLEEAPPLASTDVDLEAEEEAAEEINVSVGGDVSAGGTITVAGRDIVYNILPPEKQTKNQDRRFEAAFPREAHRDETYDLWVVVALPDAPPFFTDDQEANIVEEKPDSPVSVEFEVDRSTGALKPAEVEVQVTGDGFEIVGPTKRILTVNPDGTPDKRRFLAKAVETGEQRLIIEFMQDGKLLKEMTIAAEVFAPDKKPAGALNLSFQVAIFGVTLSFAAGGAA